MVTHHGSYGHIYSFGYQGVLKQIKNITVGLYEVRKRFENESQHDVENVAGTIEEMISVEMSLASNSMSKLVAHADRLILPVLDVASKMQQDYSDIFLKRTIIVFIDVECKCMY